MSDKVLILQLSRLGDLLQTSVLINSLKQQAKNVFLIGDEKNVQIADEIGILDKFIPLNIGKYINFLKNNMYSECFNELVNFIDNLNKENFAEIYNLNHSDINYFLSTLIHAEVKKGFKVEENRFINFIYNVMKNRKENRFNLVDIFNFFADKPIVSENLFINREVSEKNMIFIKKISKNRENIVVHLGAGHPLREWGVSNFVSLSEKILKEFNVNIILTGTKNERHSGKEFIKLLNKEFKDRVLNLIGKTDISLLKTILLNSSLLISADTGIMHMASACGIKIVALFYTSAYLFETGPYSKKALIVAPDEICYPCTEFRQSCSNIHCKKNISTEDVMSIIRYSLGTSNKRELEQYLSTRDNIIIYEPYFDKFGICYKNILNNIRFDKIREKGFGYA